MNVIAQSKISSLTFATSDMLQPAKMSCKYGISCPIAHPIKAAGSFFCKMRMSAGIVTSPLGLPSVTFSRNHR
jgi:hypothetical protein